MNLRNKSDLEIFIEKEKILRESSFVKKFDEGGSTAILQWDKKLGYDEVVVGPEGEEVLSALFTLRMFIQNNDRISIRNISKIFQEEPDLDSRKSYFESVRIGLNCELDKKIGIKFFDDHYTYREALNLYLYSVGHTNREYTEKWKEMSEAPFAGAMFKNAVNLAIALLVGNIEILSNITQEALDELYK